MIDTVQLMDVFEYLNTIEDNSIDLAIIDPPYNLNKGEWDNFSSKAFWEFTRKYLLLTAKKLKKTGSLYIFNTAFNSAYILKILVEECNMQYKNWIVWYKKDGFSANRKKYANNQETILFFTKTDEYVFNRDEIRVPYMSTDRIRVAREKGILKDGKRWFPNENGKLCSDVWEFPSVRLVNKIHGRTIKQLHPTSKPEAMIERMIKASSNKGDIVMDLFSGSGTTAYVAAKNGRHFTGCENNVEYFEYIKERLKNVD